MTTTEQGRDSEGRLGGNRRDAASSSLYRVQVEFLARMALRADIGWRDQGAGWTASVAERSDLLWARSPAIDGHPHPI